MSFIQDIVQKLWEVAPTLLALPKQERDEYRKVLDDTFKMMDTIINMIIIKLGNINHIADDSQFLNEVTLLDNYQDWLTKERDFELCKSLRDTLSETRSARQKLVGKISVNNWDALIGGMEKVLNSERPLAEYISAMFREVSDMPRNNLKVDQIRETIKGYRDSLDETRHALISLESMMYGVI
jgi:hypothetical protein